MNKIPTATYRLQFNKDFTFTDACEIIDYLKELNVSHLYLSPIFSSSPESNHGYDVTDFSSISEERGGETGFKELIDTISAYDYRMKLILDIVPNHMAATTDNPYWLDVLRNGQDSKYWPLFDMRVDENQKIALPILDSDTELSKLKLTDGGIKFGDTIYPLNTASAKKLKENPSIDLLSLLDMQYYKLVPWQDISSSMSYRRFFDVTGLIGVRVESDDIYQETHKALFELIERYPCIEGVRVDHIDGLADPKTYLDRLSKSVTAVWIEKILSRPEDISRSWKTVGTTGYEFIDRINQLFIHPCNLQKIQNHWIEKTQSKWKDFETCVFESKQQVLDELFAPELKRIIELSVDSENLKPKASLFWNALTVSLDIYRFYNEEDLKNSEWLDKALKVARENFGNDFIDAEKVFLPQFLSPKSDAHRKALQEWQQLSGPVMAKGLEDTAHYRFTPLTALNEVGCIPLIEEPTKEEYFKWIQKRADSFPFALNSTSTHDTKRSEDTRQRLYALADNPDLWIEFTDRVDLLSDTAIPNSTRYFIYQSMLGTWPLNGNINSDYRARIKEYLKKASREAKVFTNWMKPSNEYEAAVDNFIDFLLDSDQFIGLAKNFTNSLSLHGAINSLAILAVKILSPGIPDIYQGMEKWEFDLVDPDNRRPVDYDLRRKILLTADDVEEKDGRKVLLDYLSRNWKDGMVKAWLTRELLAIRGKYISNMKDFKITELQCHGKYADNLISYRLSDKKDENGLIILCPRYPGLFENIDNLSIDWEDTGVEVPAEANALYDLIQKKTVPPTDLKLVSRIFTSLPVAVISFQ